MSRCFLGLDLSYTGTGITVIKGKSNIPAFKRLVSTEPKDGTDVERCMQIAAEIKRIAELFKIEYAGIENYAFGKSFGGEKLGELGGIVKRELHVMGVRYATVPPQSLKVWAIGKAYTRDEGKRRMIEQARMLGCNTYDDNIADAYHAARWMREQASQPAAV